VLSLAAPDSKQLARISRKTRLFLPGAFRCGKPISSLALFSSHRKLLSLKATVVNVAEKPEQDFGRHD
jgi:hypothetical protein